MVKMKLYYYTMINTEKSENEVFKEYPDEFIYDSRRGKMKLIKDTIEVVSEDVEYGEG